MSHSARDFAWTAPSPPSAFPYSAFLERIGSSGIAGNSSWNEAAAGLSALRVVDGWLDGGDPESWGAAASSHLIGLLDDECATKQPLLHLLTVAQSRLSDFSRNEGIRAMWKYARALELEGEWSRATDVYESVHAKLPAEWTKRRTTCLIRIGYCHRWTTDPVRAVRAYKDARSSARINGDVAGALRAQIGLAGVAIVKGNLPLAERILRVAAKQGRRLRCRGVLARALQDLGYIAHLRGHYDAAVQFHHRALRLTSAPEARNRIVGDMASAFLSMGMRELARDVYVMLATTANQHLVRWGALYSLLEIESELGNLAELQRYEKLLLGARMAPYQRTLLYVMLGKSYRRLGDHRTGSTHLEHALALAVQHGIGQAVIEAEEALRERTGTKRPTKIWDEEPVRDIAHAVRALAAAANRAGQRG